MILTGILEEDMQLIGESFELEYALQTRSGVTGAYKSRGLKVPEEEEEPDCYSGPCCNGGSWLEEGAPCVEDDAFSCTEDDHCTATHECDSILQDGQCLIAETCYEKDEINPNNTCESCSPDISSEAWSPVGDGTICDAGSGVDSGQCENGVCELSDAFLNRLLHESISPDEAEEMAGKPPAGNANTEEAPQIVSFVAPDEIHLGADFKLILFTDFQDLSAIDGAVIQVAGAQSYYLCSGSANPTGGVPFMVVTGSLAKIDDIPSHTFVLKVAIKTNSGVFGNYKEIVVKVVTSALECQTGLCCNGGRVMPSGTICMDNDPCTYGDTCNGAGECLGTEVVCEDEPGPCGVKRTCDWTDTCLEVFPWTETSCDDEDPCTYGDTCDHAGGCTGTLTVCENDPTTCGVKRSCNGTDACTEEYPNDATSCDNQESCTYNDVCDGAGSCVGTAIVCEDDLDVCGPRRSCNGTAECTETLPGEETSCDDNDPCTHTDVCQGNVECNGILYSCNNHGTCNGDGSCSCEEVYTGDFCDQCADGYLGYPDCIEVGSFITVTVGTFWMGSPMSDCPEGYPGNCLAAEPGRQSDEELHEVTLTYDFEILAHEVTQGEFEGLLGWNPSTLDWSNCCGSDHPVYYLSWFDSLVYANKRSLEAGLTACYALSDIICGDETSVGSDTLGCMNETQTGISSATVTLANGVMKPQDCEGYRLPTEAEWEYSIRTGNQYTAFYQSDGNDGTINESTVNLCIPTDFNLDQIAVYCGNDPNETAPVGTKAPNHWGLYDMSGNVSEWVWDWYQLSYQNDVELDPRGPATGSLRVRRGGFWNEAARNCRSAGRFSLSPATRGSSIGFRLSKSLHPESCASNPCNGNGSCEDSAGHAICTCNSGYDGADCSVCAKGYYGSDCSLCAEGYYEYPQDSGTCIDDPCIPAPCNGHGVCDNATGVALCTCDNEYMMEDCGECFPYFTGYPDCVWDGTFPESYCDFNSCWPVPPTGQTVCHTWIYPWEELTCPGGSPASCGDSPATVGCGQDAQYADNARTFTCYNAAGVETPCGDLQTAADNEVVADNLTGLVWQRTWTDDNKIWQEAMDYCSITLNEGSGYAGYTDWRLPNPHELRSIVDYNVYSPAIDTNAFPGTPSSWFWSSTPDVFPGMAWAAESDFGSTSSYEMETYPFKVRCVRGQPEESGTGVFNHFLISGEAGKEIVTDLVTDLIWQKNNETDKTWQQALAYCEELDYADRTDWRLPNVNELASLVNIEIEYPASDFPDIAVTDYFWSSSSCADLTGYAWWVDSPKGYVYYGDKTETVDVRCVRGGP